MKRTRKQLLSISLILSLLLSLLTGCGMVDSHLPAGSREETMNTENSTEAAETTSREMSTEEMTTKEPVTEEPETEAPTTAVPLTEVPAGGTTAESTEAQIVEIELSADEVKTPIHTFSWGEGSGQLGFWRDESGIFGDSGPSYFAVEDGVIYVLDKVNHRVVIYEEGSYTEIDVKQFAVVTNLKYQNHLIGVLNAQKRVTGIYRKDGTLLKQIDHSKMDVDGRITNICEVGENHVVWGVYTGHYANSYYRYDWENDSLEELSDWGYSHIKVNAPMRRDYIVIVGVEDEAVYYGYTDVDNWVYVLNKEADGYRWYTKIDLTGMRTYANQYMYYSEDGRFYVMECWEEKVVISEVKFESKNQLTK